MNILFPEERIGNLFQFVRLFDDSHPLDDSLILPSGSEWGAIHTVAAASVSPVVPPKWIASFPIPFLSGDHSVFPNDTSRRHVLVQRDPPGVDVGE